MPELPEVGGPAPGSHPLRSVAGSSASRWAADPIVFAESHPGRIRRALLGRRVRAVRRHGKHFWFELDRRPWLSVHFGMAGRLHATRQTAVRILVSL